MTIIYTLHSVLGITLSWVYLTLGTRGLAQNLIMNHNLLFVDLLNDNVRLQMLTNSTSILGLLPHHMSLINSVPYYSILIHNQQLKSLTQFRTSTQKSSLWPQHIVLCRNAASNKYCIFIIVHLVLTVSLHTLTIISKHNVNITKKMYIVTEVEICHIKVLQRNICVTEMLYIKFHKIPKFGQYYLHTDKY